MLAYLALREISRRIGPRCIVGLLSLTYQLPPLLPYGDFAPFLGEFILTSPPRAVPCHISLTPKPRAQRLGSSGCRWNYPGFDLCHAHRALITAPVNDMRQAEPA